MRDFTLVSCKMIRVDDNQFEKHFCFFSYVLLQQTEVIFPPLYTSSKNRMCNGMSSFVRKFVSYKQRDWQRESKQPHQTFFTSHLWIHKRNDNSLSHTYRFIFGIHYWIKMWWILSDFSKLIISKEWIK